MALSYNPSMNHSQKERWICIYPAYLNSKKSLQQGRKLAKDKCIENPAVQEIKDVLLAAGFKVELEGNKIHPKERSKETYYRGRVRVQLKEDSGDPCNPNFPTRDSLLEHLGMTIPKLKTRQSKQQVADQSGQQSSTGAVKKSKKGRR